MSQRRGRPVLPLFGRALGLVVVAAAVGLAGCSAGGRNPVTAASRCSGPGLSPTEIDLGVIFPSSGSSASTFSPYRAGVEARLGVANNAGGIGGRKVSYHWADDQGLPSGNLTAAQGLIRQGVFSIVEISTATAGGAPLFHQQQVPVVGTGIDPVWSTYRNMFSFAYYVALGPAISTWGAFVKAQGGHRTALLHSDLDGGSRAIYAQYSNSLKAAGVAVDPIEADVNVTSPAEVVAQIARNHDDALTGSGDATLFAQIAMAARQQLPGQLKVILSPIGYDQEFLDVFGRSLPGLTTAIAYTPFEQHTAPIQRFLQAMSDYSPQIQPAENEISLAGWMDTDMTLTGLAAAGPCPTRARFMAALRNDTHYDAGGLLVTPVDLKTNFGQLSRCYTFVQIAPSGTSWRVVQPARYCGHPLDR